MTTFSQSKVGKNLDGFFLLLDGRLDKILNGDHALKLTVHADKWQVTNVRGQHFLHAKLDAIIWLGSNELAARCSNLLDQGVFRSTTEQSNLGDVVTLRDDSA